MFCFEPKKHADGAKPHAYKSECVCICLYMSVTVSESNRPCRSRFCPLLSWQSIQHSDSRLLDILFGATPYRNLERVNLCRSRAVRRICCSLLECWESSGRIQRGLHMDIPGGTPYTTHYARWNVGKDYFPLFSRSLIMVTPISLRTSHKAKHLISSLVSDCQKCLFEQTLPNGVFTSRVENLTRQYNSQRAPSSLTRLRWLPPPSPTLS